jgi:hypothetical protein
MNPPISARRSFSSLPSLRLAGRPHGGAAIKQGRSPWLHRSNHDYHAAAGYPSNLIARPCNPHDPFGVSNESNPTLKSTPLTRSIDGLNTQSDSELALSRRAAVLRAERTNGKASGWEGGHAFCCGLWRRDGRSSWLIAGNGAVLYFGNHPLSHDQIKAAQL